MYKKPYIHIIIFSHKDVICTSNVGPEKPSEEDWWTDFL